MNSIQHDMMNLTSDNRKKKQDHIIKRNKDNAGWNNLHKRVTTENPDWKPKHMTTVKDLVTSLTKFGQQQVKNLLKLEQIDKNTIDLKTIVDKIFLTKIDRYEYQDILLRIQNLEKVDEAAALYCSEQRINNLKTYKHNYQIMKDKF